MAHAVVIGSWSVYSGGQVHTAFDTSAAGFDLMEFGITTQIVDPRTGRVTESLKIQVTGSSLANLRSKLATIYNVADIARRFENGESDLFAKITVKGGNSGNLYTSVIHAMEVQVPDSLLASDWANWRTEVTVIYERDGWWENVTVSGVLTMTNPNGTSDRMTIYNCNDLTGSSPNILTNYVDIDTADIVGDMATPLYLDLRMMSNTVTGNSRVYFGGIGGRGSLYLPTLFYEAEDASGGTPTADANSSGGDYNLVSISTSAETDLLTFTPVQFDMTGKYWYKVIGRFANTTSLGDVKFRWKVLSGTTVIWQGPQFMLENATNLIQEMGEIPLPPSSGFSGSFTFVLTGQRTTGDTETLSLDYIQLMASHCAVKAVGVVALEYTQDLYVPVMSSDPRELMPGRYASSVYYRDWYTEWAKCLLVNPGDYYRIHFVVQSEVGATAEKNRYSYVYFLYKPRYRAVGE